MRISIAKFILLGTAFAAPFTQVDRSVETLQASDLIYNDPLPLIGRARVGPAPVPPPRPQPANPRPGGRPNGPARPRPAGPEAEPEPASPNEPAPVDPPSAGSGCGRKRCTGPNSYRTQKIERNYLREDTEIMEDLDKSGGKYLSEVGIGPNDKWYTTTIANTPQQKARFNEILNDFDASIEARTDLNNFQKTRIKNRVKSLGGDNAAPIMDQQHVPEKGLTIAKNSYNSERDLYKEYVGEFNRKEYTRPGVGDRESRVQWKDMFMDNWRQAAQKKGVEVNSLKYVARDGIVTQRTLELFDQIVNNSEDQTFTQTDAAFNWISESMHARGVKQMVQDYATELDHKEIISYRVTKEKNGWNMLIELGRPGQQPGQ